MQYPVRSLLLGLSCQRQRRKGTDAHLVGLHRLERKHRGPSSVKSDEEGAVMSGGIRKSPSLTTEKTPEIHLPPALKAYLG
ncbi:hypothetical protein NDU88_000719 [Pleurodeles waltl]|uniref:Uncharacterized protein n=1 Tax=Pleurodeles waltl TaxID=8319 RepID=A0AAV7S7S8_PLEWA|nr:hypothetical protein NDU88_000719 [Pleurodeles waltl]